MYPFHSRTRRTVFFLLLLVLKVNSETFEVMNSLVQFMENIDPGNSGRDSNFGWNLSSDPCGAGWKGVYCMGTPSVKKIVLDGLNLSGNLDARFVCSAKNLTVLSLNHNNVVGSLPEEISDCAHLTHLYLSRNNFTGNLPGSLARLNNLKRIDISRNGFAGALPDLSAITGLTAFRAEFNNLSGEIPDFDFSDVRDFNVSFNNLSGSIPDVNGQLNASSFVGNAGLCGKPLPNPCP